ncbi:MAG: hypothetical protein ABL901_18685 [Hyphomicrobiaceae bacterium]
MPKTNTVYWLPKLQRNVERDRRNRDELERLGWRVLIVWECETKDLDELRRRLRRFLT